MRGAGVADQVRDEGRENIKDFIDICIISGFLLILVDYLENY